jgi:hypothetical protein
MELDNVVVLDIGARKCRVCCIQSYSCPQRGRGGNDDFVTDEVIMRLGGDIHWDNFDNVWRTVFSSMRILAALMFPRLPVTT